MTPGGFADDMIYTMWGELHDAGGVNLALWTGKLIVKEEN
jgi:hypothetical protein